MLSTSRFLILAMTSSVEEMTGEQIMALVITAIVVVILWYLGYMAHK